MGIPHVANFLVPNTNLYLSLNIPPYQRETLEFKGVFLFGILYPFYHNSKMSKM